MILVAKKLMSQERRPKLKKDLKPKSAQEVSESFYHRQYTGQPATSEIFATKL
jgi:hypothetical protein